MEHLFSCHGKIGSLTLALVVILWNASDHASAFIQQQPPPRTVAVAAPQLGLMDLQVSNSWLLSNSSRKHRKQNEDVDLTSIPSRPSANKDQKKRHRKERIYLTHAQRVQLQRDIRNGYAMRKKQRLQLHGLFNKLFGPGGGSGSLHPGQREVMGAPEDMEEMYHAHEELRRYHSGDSGQRNMHDSATTMDHDSTHEDGCMHVKVEAGSDEDYEGASAFPFPWLATRPKKNLHP